MHEHSVSLAPQRKMRSIFVPICAHAKLGNFCKLQILFGVPDGI